MTPAARLAAAIEVLEDIAVRRRPAADSLKEWGLAHRFAGSKDRSAIAGLVWDSLRVKSSSAWLMGEKLEAATARGIALGALNRARGLDITAISSLCNGEGHAPPPPSEAERARLTACDMTGAPAHVLGDYPEWLAPQLEEAWGDRAAEEGRALAARAPVDLRANLLLTDRDSALAELDHLGPRATRFSPWGLRIDVGVDGRAPALSAEPSYVKGQIEVQDEGSQIAALLSGAEPGWQVLDLCAGGGGKTLCLAAMMDNKGQLYATDKDGRRLSPIFERLERAGVRNVQVRAPKGKQDILADLAGRCDLVVVDAPCTGAGAWRRNPDAKWRVRPGALELRIRDQDEALNEAARFVKPGGRIAYVTCSVLKAENEDRVNAFLNSHADYLPIDMAHAARKAGLPELADCGSKLGPGLRLSPATTDTDGFYVALLTRSA
jgi:16S rRNA (cytosine967-C5)-methyltransferase